MMSRDIGSPDSDTLLEQLKTCQTKLSQALLELRDAQEELEDSKQQNEHDRSQLEMKQFALKDESFNLQRLLMRERTSTAVLTKVKVKDDYRKTSNELRHTKDALDSLKKRMHDLNALLPYLTDEQLAVLPAHLKMELSRSRQSMTPISLLSPRPLATRSVRDDLSDDGLEFDLDLNATPPPSPNKSLASLPVDSSVIDNLDSDGDGDHNVRDRRQIDERFDAIVNLIASQKALSSHLGAMESVYAVKLSGMLDDRESKILFSNIAGIRKFVDLLAAEMAARMSDWTSKSLIADVFVKLAPNLKPYAVYCTGYDKVKSIYNKIKAKQEIHKLLEVCRAQGKDQYDLAALLDMPVQQMTRYQTFLQDVLRMTSEDHPDYANVQSAIQIVGEITSYIDEHSRAIRMSQLNKIIQTLDDKPLPSHHVVQEAAVLASRGVYDESQEVHIFCFDDIFMITRDRKKHFIKIKNVKMNKMRELARFNMVDVDFELHDDQDCRLILNGGKGTPSVHLIFSDEDERFKWVEILADQQMNLEPTTKNVVLDDDDDDIDDALV